MVFDTPRHKTSASSIAATPIFVSDQPELAAVIDSFGDANFPRFIQQARSPIAFPNEGVDWPTLYERWPDYQFVLRDDASGELIASGNCVPLYVQDVFSDLSEHGWDWCISEAFKCHDAGRSPNTLAALAICVSPAARGSGVGSCAIAAMRGIACQRGFRHLIAPVRPTLKAMYPLISIDEYVTWKD